MSSVHARLDEAIGILKRGGVVALPTETVYGLAADATNEAAVRRIFEVKGRPHSHPLIVHVAAGSPLDEVARDVPALVRRLGERFWPGPLTLVLRRGKGASLAVTGGQDTVAVRVPDHPLALEVLRAFPRGLAAPSANRFGAVSPTSAEHVRHDLGAAVDLVLDGGPCNVGVESTIVDLSRDRPRLLRPGGVSSEEIEALLGIALERESAGPVRVPGQLPSHYAPRAELLIVPAPELGARLSALAARGARVGLLASEAGGAAASATFARVLLPDAPDGYARGLYAALRQLDALGVDIIVVAPPDGHGLGLAVADRLERAAAPRH